MWTFLFACLSRLYVWLGEAEADYRAPTSFTTLLNWVLARVETLGAAAPPSVADLVQLVVPNSDPELYQASAALGKLNTK